MKSQLYIIPDVNQIEESLKLADEYNLAFEYNDFFNTNLLDNPNELKKRIEFYLNLERDRSKDTLHGVFYDIAIHSEDSLIAEVSKARIIESLNIAKILGVKAVIFHTNIISNIKSVIYQKNWLDKNASYFTDIANQFKTIDIYIENMFDDDYEMILSLAESMKGISNFGICLDYAHAYVFGKNHNPHAWFESLKPYIKHMHINDNDGISDLHNALGEGNIEWNVFSKILNDSSVDTGILIETGSLERQKSSLEFMKQNKIYPFD